MPLTIAFFDMDYTVLDASSGLLFAKHLRQQKRLGNRLMLRIVWWTLMYKVSVIDVKTAVPKMLSYTEDQSASQTMADTTVWFENTLKAHITPHAVAKMRHHQVQGHRIVLISASTQFAVQPVAEFLQVDFLCTLLIDQDDRLTGKVVDPPCYGTGKVVWAQRYAAEHQASLHDAYFYTDSYSDRPLLDQVGHPVAVNPDARLKRFARRRRWPIEKFY